MTFDNRTSFFHGQLWYSRLLCRSSVEICIMNDISCDPRPMDDISVYYGLEHDLIEFNVSYQRNSLSMILHKKEAIKKRLKRDTTLQENMAN